jgi:segregation and condensation protein A
MPSSKNSAPPKTAVTPTVTVANFEGPLGLLLELVEDGKLEVTAIAVGTVTRQYLDRVSGMAELGRQDLAQFLELGARLVYIKSLALLPGSDDDETPLAELRQLNQELAEYRLFQAATQNLRSRLAEGQRSYRRTTVPRLHGSQLPAPEIDLVQLGALFSEALERTKPAPQTVISNDHYDQAEIAERLYSETTKRQVLLNEVIAACHDRAEIIVTFLAILELVRGERVTVQQSRPFDDIVLVALV